MINKISKGRFAHVCLFVFFFVLLIIFAFPMCLGIVHTGTIAGTAGCVVVLSIVLFPKAYTKALSFLWKRKITRGVFAFFGAFFTFGIMLALFVSANIICSAEFNRADGNENALIVLGCKVNGTTPSLMLRGRIDAAYEYYLENPDVTIIASGGQGEDENISEAMCIKNELVKMGVPEELILTEDKSTSTYENIKFSLQFFSANNIEPRIAVATDGFHQYRVHLIANSLSDEAYNMTGYPITVKSVSATTPLYLLPSYFIREWFGVVDWYLFG